MLECGSLNASCASVSACNLQVRPTQPGGVTVPHRARLLFSQRAGLTERKESGKIAADYKHRVVVFLARLRHPSVGNCYELCYSV